MAEVETDRRDKPLLLLAGGDTDPQLLRLLKQATVQQRAVHALLTGQSGMPQFCWDVKTNRLLDDDREVKPHAAFIRQDVFAYLRSNQVQDQSAGREWYVAVAGWLLANPQVRVFNRAFLHRGPVNKPYILHLALQLGLEVADTFVTNDGRQIAAWAATSGWIGKPVGGGAHCEALSATDSVAVLSVPQIVQRRLDAPEIRVFRIGPACFGFQIVADALDYRTSTATRVVPVAVSPELQQQMLALADTLGLDFAAADFKTDPASGRLQFLEINTNPMFAGFDQQAGGMLSRAMLHWLMD